MRHGQCCRLYLPCAQKIALDFLLYLKPNPLFQKVFTVLVTLEAVNQGLGSCWMGAISPKEAHRVMNLPMDLFVHGFFFFWDMLTRIQSPDLEKSLTKSFSGKNTDDLNLRMP